MRTAPRPRGRSRSSFDYFQRRLPQPCARYRITTVAQARPILEELVGYSNERRRHQGTGETPTERWARGIRHGRGRVRPVPEGVDLVLVFALQHERLVHSDGKVRFLAQCWPVSAPPRSRVTVCWRPDEDLTILWNGHRVGAYRP